MPTYRYECGRCKVVHEIFHSISEKHRTKCTDCGGKLTRLIGSGGGVLLRGSGFYTTDYRPDSYHSAAKKDSESASPKSDAPKGDGASKPAASGDGANKPAASGDGAKNKGKKKEG